MVISKSSIARPEQFQVQVKDVDINTHVVIAPLAPVLKHVRLVCIRSSDWPDFKEIRNA
ncbi:hypothetical protein LG200_12805 [Methylobacillus caricis]|uniref:hypothetical protein n=1 Tax=Methylobacillus caricis TaxID=1971611 RepID=UPI001CFFEF6D|nr:hypothetical protein [Methylobacillus caricis]MCB5188883.1 hypothetical protein [Methylobacillus caricis]